MSRNKKRKRNRVAKRRSATAVQKQSKVAASPLERLLNIADHQPNPDPALEMFQMALDKCQHVATVPFDSAGDHLGDMPHASCYLRAVFGVATSLWRLNRIEESARHLEEVLRADPVDHLFARYWLAACLLGAGGWTN